MMNLEWVVIFMLADNLKAKKGTEEIKGIFVELFGGVERGLVALIP